MKTSTEFGCWSRCQGCIFRGYLANQGMVWCNIGCHPAGCGYYTSEPAWEKITVSSDEEDWDDDEDPNPYNYKKSKKK